MCLIISYYYSKFEDEVNYIMKNKGPFMKIVLWMKLLKPNFDIDFFWTHFRFFNIPIIQ